MSVAWPDVAVGDVAQPAERSEPVSPEKVYRQIGVRLWGKGAYERERVAGSETRYTSFNVVQKGDIIVNKIWACNGSIAVVPEALDGCYCSGEFPIFAPNPASLDPRWFHWYTMTSELWNQCTEMSFGTSGKTRMRPDRFLAVRVPLPPITEQRRIVARLDQLVSIIEQTRRLRQRIGRDCNAVCQAFFVQNGDYPLAMTPMREILSLRQQNTTVRSDETYHFAGVYSFGRGVFPGQSKAGSEFAYSSLTRLRTGNFVYPKLMAWEGALGAVPPECDGLVVSPEFPVFELDQERVLPETLDAYFRTPSVWPALAGASTGTNVRRRRLNPHDFLEYVMPLPPIAIQRRIQTVHSKLAVVKGLQDHIEAESDALVSSVLSSAFRGEL